MDSISQGKLSPGVAHTNTQQVPEWQWLSRSLLLILFYPLNWNHHTHSGKDRKWVVKGWAIPPLDTGKRDSFPEPRALESPPSHKHTKDWIICQLYLNKPGEGGGGGIKQRAQKWQKKVHSLNKMWACLSPGIQLSGWPSTICGHKHTFLLMSLRVQGTAPLHHVLK